MCVRKEKEKDLFMSFMDLERACERVDKRWSKEIALNILSGRKATSSSEFLS